MKIADIKLKDNETLKEQIDYLDQLVNAENLDEIENQIKELKESINGDVIIELMTDFIVQIGKDQDKEIDELNKRIFGSISNDLQSIKELTRSCLDFLNHFMSFYELYKGFNLDFIQRGLKSFLEQTRKNLGEG